jgi:dolichyl-phosphate-mannose--protein O-mannosyl transferase
MAIFDCGYSYLFVILAFLFITFDDVLCKKFNYEYVTCGSALKLLNNANNVRLHSHDVKYGSGSGQQSVTAVESSDDHNSYWRIRGKMGSDCTRGAPIKCNSVIRLTHLNTQKNLHSHHFQSPLSHNYEVSAFGESGEGDEGDLWKLICTGNYWRRSDKVRLQHVVTNHYLHVSGDTYGRPISGQREVSGYSSMSDLNYWTAAEGIFVKPSEGFESRVTDRDEL